jgi:hypothetical protein
MSFNVIVTEGFKKQSKKIAKKHRSLKNDLLKLIDSLEQNPIQGEPLGPDCFKIRVAIASKVKGKSGGARVITCVKLIQQNVYLIAIYDKSNKSNILENELNELLILAGLLPS